MPESKVEDKNSDSEAPSSTAPLEQILESSGANSAQKGSGFWQNLPLRLMLAFFAGAIFTCLSIWTAATITHHRKKEAALKELDIQVPDDEVDLKDSLAEAILHLKEKEYLQARRLLIQLLGQSHTEHIKTVLEGLMSATYDGLGQHRAGIDYLCNIYQDKSQEDVRYRFNFAVHLREIAEKEGMNTAEELISTLKPKCKRADLSYIWIGIPRVKSENLKKGMTVYEDSFKLGKKDIQYLEYAIKRYPNDLFLDHALYFLGMFDDVIRKYPDSLILDVVYRAAGRRSLNLGNPDEAIGYLKIATNRWPRSPHWNEFVKIIAEAYKKKNDTESAVKWLTQLRADKGKALADLIGQKDPFRNSQEVKIFLQTLKRRGATNEQLANLFDSDCKERFDLASKSLWSLDYDNAINEYMDTKNAFLNAHLEVPGCIETGIRILKIITDNDRLQEEQLFQTAFYLRDDAPKEMGNEDLTTAGAILWTKFAEKFPHNDKAPRALYLAAALERRSGFYDESARHFRELSERYPKSELADDALTEVGWYYLFVKGNPILARRYFQKVINEYADKNAADNSLNWLARSYYREGNYDLALSTYNQLVKRYPYGRLAIKYGRSEINTLKPVVNSKRWQNKISGLSFSVKTDSISGIYVFDVITGSDAGKAGILPNDIITSVNGKGVDSIDSFMAELESAKSAPTVTLTLTRSRNQEISLIVKIKPEFYYAVLPGDP